MKMRYKFYKILVIVVLAFAILLFIDKKTNISLKLKDVSFNVSKVFDEFLIFRDYKSIYLENKDLNNKIIEHENNNLRVRQLEEELLELKNEMDLKKVYVDYDLIYSTVIMKDKMYFQNILTIDKGLNDEIKIGDAVITKDGLLGIVFDAFDNNSTVKLLGEDVNISIKVSNDKGEVYGSLAKYEDGFYIIEDINNYENVKIGDKVVTTGMGNLPSGILIGYVKEMKQDSYGISNILYVSNNMNVDAVKYVAVLKDNE